MQPIKDVLTKIKWDENTKKEEFTIHYLDSVEKKMVALKFLDIIRQEGSFIVIEKNSQETFIPLHRIKQVTEKENIIWKRQLTNQKEEEE